MSCASHGMPWMSCASHGMPRMSCASLGALIVSLTASRGLPVYRLPSMLSLRVVDRPASQSMRMPRFFTGTDLLQRTCL